MTNQDPATYFAALRLACKWHGKQLPSATARITAYMASRDIEAYVKTLPSRRRRRKRKVG